MFALLYFSFSLIALVIASYTDLKQRIVSDKISYGLITLGISLHGIQAIRANDYSILAVSIALSAITFAAGYGLWKLGVWAGGDVKLFAGLAAMNPINPNAFGASSGIELLKAIALPVFPLSLFVFSVFAMLPLGIVLSIKALKEKAEKRKAIARDLKKKALQIAELSIATIGFGLLLEYLKQNVLLVVPILIVLGIVPKAIRIPAITLVAAFALAKQPLGFFSSTLSLFAFLLCLFAIIKIALESKGLLNKQKKITELQEGDIVAETIIVKNNSVERFKGIEIGKVINYLKTNNLQAIKEHLRPAGRIVCSHRHAGGLEAQEIKELQEFAKKGLLEDSIEVKQSAAFVPAVLIAYIALNIVGDLLWNIILR